MSRLIDADALTERLNEYANDDWNVSLGGVFTDAVDTCLDFVENAPTIEAVQVVYGFNDNRNYHEADEFCCSECGLHLEDWSRRVYDEENDDEFWVEYVFKYCPECGAKMKGGAK